MDNNKHRETSVKYSDTYLFICYKSSFMITAVVTRYFFPSGSHMLPSYYRRPFISDSDFCPSTKQFSPDVYSSNLGGKPLGCEPSTMTSYPSFIDSYYPETFGDYRSAATFSSSGSSFLPSSAISSLLPPFSGEPSHLYLVGHTQTHISSYFHQTEDFAMTSILTL